MQKQIEDLATENNLLKQKLEETERALKESQNALLAQFAVSGSDFHGEIPGVMK
jgi:hypothetical protein